MSFVTVKQKFQVTIPAKLRKGFGLREGDIMEASVVDNGILLRPKELVDRRIAADRIAAALGAMERTAEDESRSEGKIMQQAIADIAEARRSRRNETA